MFALPLQVTLTRAFTMEALSPTCRLLGERLLQTTRVLPAYTAVSVPLPTLVGREAVAPRAFCSSVGSILITAFNPEEAKSRIADIKDGTANTAMIGERVGGDTIYEKGGQVSALSSLLGPANGGGWGDIMNGEMWYHGTRHDGVNPHTDHGAVRY